MGYLVLQSGRDKQQNVISRLRALKGSCDNTDNPKEKTKSRHRIPPLPRIRLDNTLEFLENSVSFFV